MKKFYEAPVVELTGFSVEDVITTSAVDPIVNTAELVGDAETAFKAAVINDLGYSAANKYGSGSYEW